MEQSKAFARADRLLSAGRKISISFLPQPRWKKLDIFCRFECIIQGVLHAYEGTTILLPGEGKLIIEKSGEYFLFMGEVPDILNPHKWFLHEPHSGSGFPVRVTLRGATFSVPREEQRRIEKKWAPLPHSQKRTSLRLVVSR